MRPESLIYTATRDDEHSRPSRMGVPAGQNATDKRWTAFNVFSSLITIGYAYYYFLVI